MACAPPLGVTRRAKMIIIGRLPNRRRDAVCSGSLQTKAAAIGVGAECLNG